MSHISCWSCAQVTELKNIPSVFVDEVAAGVSWPRQPQMARLTMRLKMKKLRQRADKSEIVAEPTGTASQRRKEGSISTLAMAFFGASKPLRSKGVHSSPPVRLRSKRALRRLRRGQSPNMPDTFVTGTSN